MFPKIRGTFKEVIGRYIGLHVKILQGLGFKGVSQDYWYLFGGPKNEDYIGVPELRQTTNSIY